MKREEFTALPIALAMAALWDAIHATEAGKALDDMEAPAVPRAPKYDAKIWTKAGYQWVSETHLDSLRWWLQRKEEGAASGGQYAEKDGKMAQQLIRWIAWRVCYPDKQWRGVRDDQEVTAALPSHKPKVHAYERKEQSSPRWTDDGDDFPMP